MRISANAPYSFSVFMLELMSNYSKCRFVLSIKGKFNLNNNNAFNYYFKKRLGYNIPDLADISQLCCKKALPPACSCNIRLDLQRTNMTLFDRSAGTCHRQNITEHFNNGILFLTRVHKVRIPGMATIGVP